MYNSNSRNNIKSVQIFVGDFIETIFSQVFRSLFLYALIIDSFYVFEKFTQFAAFISFKGKYCDEKVETNVFSFFMECSKLHKLDYQDYKISLIFCNCKIILIFCDYNTFLKQQKSIYTVVNPRRISHSFTLFVFIYEIQDIQENWRW